MIEGKTPERFVTVTSGVGDAKMDRLDHIIAQNKRALELLVDILEKLKGE